MSQRLSRISEEIKREIRDIIQKELKDPRLPGFVSVLSVETTRDLRYAKIYISVFGNEDDKKNALEGLKNAAGFIRREIGQRIRLRYVPELIFKIDNSIEQGIYINKLIDNIKKGDQ